MGLFPLIVLKILKVAQRRKIFRVLESAKHNLKVLALVFLTKYQQTWPLNSMQLRKQRLWWGFVFSFLFKRQFQRLPWEKMSRFF